MTLTARTASWCSQHLSLCYSLCSWAWLTSPVAPLHIEEKYLQPACNAAALGSHSNLEASHAPEQTIPSNTPGCTPLRIHFLIASHCFTWCHFILTNLNHPRVSADFRHLAAHYLFGSLRTKNLIPVLLSHWNCSFTPRLCWQTLSQFLIHDLTSPPVDSFLNSFLWGISEVFWISKQVTQAAWILPTILLTYWKACNRSGRYDFLLQRPNCFTSFLHVL